MFQFFKNQQGAFLLEALLAVMILSVGLVGLIRGLLSSLNAAKESERYSRAISVGENALLDVIRLNGKSTASVISLENDFEDFSAEIMSQPSGDLQIPGVLREVKLHITWPGAIKNKEINATTLVFGPVDEQK
ncbi:MAG: hypothetical protein H6754_02820 [Candidatus Omnitrophica bacterium]|nr:hypothetical protein [Candidatus Omnitrophota bacterium]